MGRPHLSDEVMSRPRTAFPTESVRTVDALHLATALVFQDALGAVHVVPFDERIRATAVALDLAILPAPPPRSSTLTGLPANMDSRVRGNDEQGDGLLARRPLAMQLARMIRSRPPL